MRKTVTVLAAVAVTILFSTYSPAYHGRGHFIRGDSSFIVRAGMYLPSGDSLLWEQNEELLTFRMEDWNAFVLGFGLKLAANDHLNINVCFDYYEKQLSTQYTDFVDVSGLPIRQDLKLTLVPITVSAEVLPFGRYEQRGRRGGRTPMKVWPFVGAGVGLYVYQYEEVGSQIDFMDLSIYDAYFISEGEEAGVHVTGGVDVPIGQKALFTMEARYHWVAAPLSSDFVGFDDFDLGGAQFMFGFGYRF